MDGLVKWNLLQWHLFLDVNGRLVLLRWIVPGLQLTASQEHIYQAAEQISSCQDAKNDLPLSVRLLEISISISFNFTRIYYVITHIVLGQLAHHERRQKSTQRRQRIGHTKDGAREVRCNVQTIAQVAGSHGSVQEQLSGENYHSPGVIVSDEDLHNHEETGQHNGKSCERFSCLCGGQFAGASQVIGEVGCDNGHGVLPEVGQRREKAVLEIYNNVFFFYTKLFGINNILIELGSIINGQFKQCLNIFFLTE